VLALSPGTAERSVAAPDGSAVFRWSGGGEGDDVWLELDLKPFTDAGLDVSLLPEWFSVKDGKLYTGADLVDESIGEGFSELVRACRSAIGYHTALDHFNVSLGHGNMFEWARSTAVNDATGEEQDKDIVFVLDPEPLAAAGLDVTKVEGWAYAEVEMHMDGKPVSMFKLLKPIDLR